MPIIYYPRISTGGGSVDLSNYATKTYVDQQNIIDQQYAGTLLSGSQQTQEIQTQHITISGEGYDFNSSLNPGNFFMTGISGFSLNFLYDPGPAGYEIGDQESHALLGVFPHSSPNSSYPYLILESKSSFQNNDDLDWFDYSTFNAGGDSVTLIATESGCGESVWGRQYSRDYDDMGLYSQAWGVEVGGGGLSPWSYLTPLGLSFGLGESCTGTFMEGDTYITRDTAVFGGDVTIAGQLIVSGGTSASASGIWVFPGGSIGNSYGSANWGADGITMGDFLTQSGNYAIFYQDGIQTGNWNYSSSLLPECLEVYWTDEDSASKKIDIYSDSIEIFDPFTTADPTTFLKSGKLSLDGSDFEGLGIRFPDGTVQSTSMSDTFNTSNLNIVGRLTTGTPGDAFTWANGDIGIDRPGYPNTGAVYFGRAGEYIYYNGNHFRFSTGITTFSGLGLGSIDPPDVGIKFADGTVQTTAFTAVGEVTLDQLTTVSGDIIGEVWGIVGECVDETVQGYYGTSGVVGEDFPEASFVRLAYMGEDGLFYMARNDLSIREATVLGFVDSPFIPTGSGCVLMSIGELQCYGSGWDFEIGQPVYLTVSGVPSTTMPEIGKYKTPIGVAIGIETLWIDVGSPELIVGGSNSLITGSGTFSISGTTITHNLGTATHITVVTPADTADFDPELVSGLGTIYVKRGENSDIVYKTGDASSDTLGFDYIITRTN